MDRDSVRDARLPFRATAESGADLRFEGSAGHPSRSEPEYVLPYADRDRLGALLASLEPRLTAVALRLTRDPDTARDVVQNAFEKVVRHGSRFRGGSRVWTWGHRIGAYEALMWLRAQQRQARVFRECPDERRESMDPAPGPEEALLQRQREVRLRASLMGLARVERDVLLHCALAGRSYAEHALQTGDHPAAIKSRAHRARRRLHVLLPREDRNGVA
jgi:RNA polymerase sigma-70 factor (ECF subfamily)